MKVKDEASWAGALCRPGRRGRGLGSFLFDMRSSPGDRSPPWSRWNRQRLRSQSSVMPAKAILLKFAAADATWTLPGPAQLTPPLHWRRTSAFCWPRAQSRDQFAGRV